MQIKYNAMCTYSENCCFRKLHQSNHFSFTQHLRNSVYSTNLCEARDRFIMMYEVFIGMDLCRSPNETNSCRLTLKSTFSNPFLPQLLQSSAKTDPFIFDLI